MAINGIEVSDVIIFPVRKSVKDSKLRAFAKVILNDAFIINGIRVFEGPNGLFISFPQEYNKGEKKGYDICFPITAEMRSYVSDQVLSQYSIAVSMYDNVGDRETDCMGNNFSDADPGL